jgi:hypothetical protein
MRLLMFIAVFDDRELLDGRVPTFMQTCAMA